MAERVEKTVFISYRRTNFAWANSIYHDLNANGFDVFFDVKGIASGDFESVIVENIRSRAHFLVLLTPSALERCGEPGDWLRREIETALDTRRNIVPVMLDGFDFGMPSIANRLTGKLAAIKSYNAMRIPPDYFDEGMEKLRRKFLNTPLTAVLHPASVAATKAATEQKIAAQATPAAKESELTAQQYFERAYAATDLDEKVRLYSEAIRLKPDDIDALNNRGVARNDKGDVDGAIKDYNEAIRLKPDYAFAFNNRGAALLRKGDSSAAIKDYNEAIRLKPEYVDAFVGRGWTLHNKGDFDSAINDYNEAIRLKPDDAGAFLNRGSAFYKKGDFDSAIENYSEAKRLRPDYALAFYGLGIALYHKGDFDSAIKNYNEAIRLKPDYADAFIDRSTARKKKGDLRGAEEDSKQAERIDNAAKT